jgi:replicative DNA helicase
MYVQFLIPKILKKPFKNENSERYTTQIQNHIAKSLKELAVFLKIPVIVLTQLSRNLEN